MIDLKIDSGIAVVTMTHGKANALDIELCEALAKCFDELRRLDARAVVVTGQDVFGRSRPLTGRFGRCGLCARIPSGLASAL